MYEIPLLYAILSAPAKGVGLERGARVQIPLSALKKDCFRQAFFIFFKNHLTNRDISAIIIIKSQFDL